MQVRLLKKKETLGKLQEYLFNHIWSTTGKKKGTCLRSLPSQTFSLMVERQVLIKESHKHDRVKSTMKEKHRVLWQCIDYRAWSNWGWKEVMCSEERLPWEIFIFPARGYCSQVSCWHVLGYETMTARRVLLSNLHLQSHQPSPWDNGYEPLKL